jgi:TRAP-type C4-dicarboxylate transport system permease small subunit
MLGNKIIKFVTSIHSFFSYIATAAIVIMMILLLVESLIRKVVGVSVITVNEVGGMGMYLFVALCMSWLYKTGMHVRAGFFVDLMNTKSRHILELCLHVLTLGFACLIAYLWWHMLASTFESERYYRLTGVPEWPFHIAGTIGWVLLGFAAIERFIIELRQDLNKINIK